jgi:hypothetical protein
MEATWGVEQCLSASNSLRKSEFTSFFHIRIPLELLGHIAIGLQKSMALFTFNSFYSGCEISSPAILMQNFTQND